MGWKKAGRCEEVVHCTSLYQRQAKYLKKGGFRDEGIKALQRQVLPYQLRNWILLLYLYSTSKYRSTSKNFPLPISVGEALFPAWVAQSGAELLQNEKQAVTVTRPTIRKRGRSYGYLLPCYVYIVHLLVGIFIGNIELRRQSCLGNQ